MHNGIKGEIKQLETHIRYTGIAGNHLPTRLVLWKALAFHNTIKIFCGNEYLIDGRMVNEYSSKLKCISYKYVK